MTKEFRGHLSSTSSDSEYLKLQVTSEEPSTEKKRLNIISASGANEEHKAVVLLVPSL